MTTKIIYAGVVAGVFMFLVSGEPVLAQQATINFTGRVLAATCNVTPSIPTVDLGSVSVASSGELQNNTKHAFEFRFSDCPGGAIQTAHLKFSGNESNITDALGVTGAGGVAIQITDNEGKSVPVNTASVYDVPIYGSDMATGSFSAALIPDGTPITAGTIAATALIDITYD